MKEDMNGSQSQQLHSKTQREQKLYLYGKGQNGQ